MNFKTLRVEAVQNNERYRIQGRFLGVWLNTFIFTDYFAMYYETLDEALLAIRLYKYRFNYV